MLGMSGILGMLGILRKFWDFSRLSEFWGFFENLGIFGILGIFWEFLTKKCESNFFGVITDVSTEILHSLFKSICLRRFSIFAEEPSKSIITATEPCNPVFKEAQPRPSNNTQSISSQSIITSQLTNSFS